MQILSRLYHLYPSRAAKSIPIVKSTAIRSKSPQLYELLGELQADSDPAGDSSLLLKYMNFVHGCASSLRHGQCIPERGPAVPLSPLAHQRSLSASA